MDAKERLIRAIQHEETDYVPSFFKDVQMGFMGNYEEKVRELDFTDETFMSFRGNFTYSMAGWWHVTSSCDFFAAAQSDYTFPFKSIKREDGSYVGANGCIYQRNSVDNHTYYVDGYWTSPERRAECPPLISPPNSVFHEWKQFLDQYPNFYLMPMLHGLHEGTWLNVGASTFAKVFRKPDVLHFYEGLLDDLLRVNLEICQQILEVDPSAIISFTDDIAYKDRLMLSPAKFDQIYAPRYRKLFDFIHKRGGFTMIHTDGKIDDLVPHYIDIGLDILQCLEPAANVNIYELNEKYGDKITWNGNVDVSRLLAFGPEDQVIAETKKLLKEIGCGGGYLFGPCTSTEYWQDPCMLEAMWSTYNKYKYIAK
jgi:uroporphyrinogen-III decarboxylase